LVMEIIVGCLLDNFQVMIFSDNGTDVPRPGLMKG
jgi:hypothetical protein